MLKLPVTLPGKPDLYNIRKLDRLAVPGIRSMHRYGAPINIDYLRELSVRIDRDMDKQAKLVRSHIPRKFLDSFAEFAADTDFNLDSPEQVSKLLFDFLHIGYGSRLKTTPGGDRISTGKKQLQMLEREHAIIPEILKYRELHKAKTTYVDKFPRIATLHNHGVCSVCEAHHWEDHYRLHTEILLTRADTGRFASKNPNLQNIPVRSKLGQDIRAAFQAPAGMVLVNCDYSQIELRVLAHCANEPNMIKVFVADGDIHTATAAMVFGKAVEDVLDIEERLPCKNVNFMIVYGATDIGLQLQLALSGLHWEVADCTRFIDDWFVAYPGVRQYMDIQHYHARRYGFVWDLFGGVKLIPEMKSAFRNTKEAGLRYAGNTRIQGTAAGLMKLAIWNVEKETKSWARMLLTIHDEVMQEVAEDDADRALKEVPELMVEACPQMRVPIKADAKADKEWRK